MKFIPWILSITILIVYSIIAGFVYVSDIAVVTGVRLAFAGAVSAILLFAHRQFSRLWPSFRVQNSLITYSILVLVVIIVHAAASLSAV